MIVELRSVPDCANLEPVRAALHTALAELGLPAEIIEVVGDYPSPSVLIDGVDVLGDTSNDKAAACRLDLPTVEHLRDALRQAMTATARSLIQSATMRPDRPRRAAELPDGPRRVHQAILRHFARTGDPPDAADIHAMADAAGLDAAGALRVLAADDLIALDNDGRLIAAYPFSPTPTAHRVSLGGVQVYAMCAVDALGIPFMLDTAATITSTDPHDGQPVMVAVTGGTTAFRPAHAVVAYAANADTGRSVDTCCSTINFFTCTDNATAWISAHPARIAIVLTQEEAVSLGRNIFAPLLA